MGLWHVFYEDWQMECCGTPFSLGDEVSWPVLLGAADEVLGGGWHDRLTRIAGPVEEVRGAGGALRVVRDEGGLRVTLPALSDAVPPAEPGAARPGDPVRAVGLLTVQTHGAELTEIRGVVRAIWTVSQRYAEAVPGSGTRHPVPGERSLRSVDTCPKWFGDGEDRRDAGVLVTLEVPATDSRLSRALREARGIPHDAPPGTETAGIPVDGLAVLLETLDTAPGLRTRRGPSHRTAGSP